MLKDPGYLQHIRPVLKRKKKKIFCKGIQTDGKDVQKVQWCKYTLTYACC